MNEEARLRLGAAVRAERLRKGWGKEEAARRATMSSITWSRVEGGLPIRADRLGAVENALGWEPGTATLVAAGVDVAGARLFSDVPGSVGGEPDDGEEIVFRLPPGLTPRQRERARRIARRSLDGYLEDLDPEEDE